MKPARGPARGSRGECVSWLAPGAGRQVAESASHWCSAARRGHRPPHARAAGSILHGPAACLTVTQRLEREGNNCKRKGGGGGGGLGREGGGGQAQRERRVVVSKSDIERDRDRQRQRETDRDRQRQTQTDRPRPRQRPRQRDQLLLMCLLKDTGNY